MEPNQVSPLNESTSLEERTTWRTSDIAHAAVLLTSGFKLQKTETKRERYRGHGTKHKTEFVFNRINQETNVSADDLILQYSNGDLMLDAKSVLDNLRNLKAASFGKKVG